MCLSPEPSVVAPAQEFSPVQPWHLRSITHPSPTACISPSPQIWLCSILRWCSLHVAFFLCDVNVRLSQVNLYLEANTLWCSFWNDSSELCWGVGKHCVVDMGMDKHAWRPEQWLLLLILSGTSHWEVTSSLQWASSSWWLSQGILLPDPFKLPSKSSAARIAQFYNLWEQPWFIKITAHIYSYAHMHSVSAFVLHTSLVWVPLHLWQSEEVGTTIDVLENWAIEGSVTALSLPVGMWGAGIQTHLAFLS